MPLAKPNAIYWPSFVQAQQFILAVTLYFCTAFCSTDHNAKSDCVHDDNWCDTGLNCKHWIGSLCLEQLRKILRKCTVFWVNKAMKLVFSHEYFRIPSHLFDHTMTSLSAPADANFLPSEAYDSAYTVSLWPVNVCISVPSIGSYTRTRSNAPTTNCEPSGLKQTACTLQNWGKIESNSRFQWSIKWNCCIWKYLAASFSPFSSCIFSTHFGIARIFSSVFLNNRTINKFHDTHIFAPRISQSNTFSLKNRE